MSSTENTGGATLSRELKEGILLLRGGRVAQAEEAFRQALDTQPEQAPQAHHLLGTLCYNQGRLEEAEQHLGAAVAAKSEIAPAWLELGNTRSDLGNVEGAVEAFSQALRLDPNLARAHYGRAVLRDYAEADAWADEYAALEAAYERAAPGSRDRCDLAWAIAAVLEARDDVDASLAYLAEAHAIQASALPQPYDAAAAGAYFQRVREGIDAPTLASIAALGRRTDRPVFVFGPPRSGTSLVEQILASHSEVYGAGELRAIGQLCGQLEQAGGKPFAEVFAALDDGQQRNFADAYLELLGSLGTSARRVVDKMPANLLAGAMLAGLFPEARFFYCDRDMTATAWSIYSTRFAEPLVWADTPRDLVAYLRSCQEHRDYLTELLGERLWIVDYAALVENPQTVIPALLAHIGLPMEPACLESHRTDRAVRTASTQQVRQPIYRDADAHASACVAQFPALRDALHG